ncbi:hypothetical protein ES703_35264 [subsurface metagenome]
MSKLKNPLCSLDARNTIGKAVSFVKRRGQNIAEKKPVVPDAKTLAQLSWRHMYQKAVALWHALSAAEKEDWESSARPKHMTGFAWFMSQALKPNPGLYLPLQGGTMQGVIEMDGYHIHGLPLPIHVQDVWRRKDFQDFTLPYLYNEGARVYHNANISIPHDTVTYLPFNSERFDTDTIHDNVTNNSRLTCLTAGKYLITAHVRFLGSATGYRQLTIILGRTLEIARFIISGLANIDQTLVATTIWDLAIDQYLEVSVYQNSTVALNIRYLTAFSPEFMMQRIGA